MVVKFRPLKLFLLVLLALALSCCSTRRQFAPGEIPQVTDLSEADENYGHEVLNMMMEQYELDRNDQNISRVRNIVDKLAESADSNAAPWHVYVLNDDSVENAGATRGNYIFVWTGMLKRVHDDNELAAVLAHELSHVLAGHTLPSPAEEFSQMLSQISGEVAGQVVSSQGQIGIVADLAGTLAQALINAVIVNPEEQRKELEADQIGLFLMAKANYDPQKAVEFWERMQLEGLGDFGPVQFFSSHPSSDERLEQLRALLPEALALKASINGVGKDGKGGYSSEWTINTDKKIKAKTKEKKKTAPTAVKKKPKTTPTPQATPTPLADLPW